jgi:hypothetical protein
MMEIVLCKYILMLDWPFETTQVQLIFFSSHVQGQAKEQTLKAGVYEFAPKRPLFFPQSSETLSDGGRGLFQSKYQKMSWSSVDEHRP